MRLQICLINDKRKVSLLIINALKQGTVLYDIYTWGCTEYEECSFAMKITGVRFFL